MSHQVPRPPQSVPTPGPWIKDDCRIISRVPTDWNEGEVPRETIVIDCRGAMGGKDVVADALLLSLAPEMRGVLETIRNGMADDRAYRDAARAILARLDAAGGPPQASGREDAAGGG